MTDTSGKGYWIANSDISDLNGLSLYRAVMTQYGARFPVMHGQQIVEGYAGPQDF